MGLRIAVLLSFCYISFFLKTINAGDYDITSYGAVGDGQTDDSNAFVQAWADVCKDDSNPTLIIPSGMTFVTSCLSFSGPCSSSSVNIQLLGDISAPTTVQGWNGCNANGQLIIFQNIQGLIIDGPGTFDGKGDIWWPNPPQVNGPVCQGCASMLRFHNCNRLQLRGTKHLNPPNSHMHINGCQDVQLVNLQITAPATSPNTDGIDISSSSHIIIEDSTIQTGDDCVAINGGTSDINITGVACGPGHGISIGSLGVGGSFASVEQVRVQNCNITDAQNGLRIKTIPFGTGYARGIVYQDIQLNNVGNPIIIDQHYCRSSPSVNHDCPIPPGADAVQVSDVTYTNIYGSSASQQAITFDCSDMVKCTGIQTNNVNINGDGVVAYCVNTQGDFSDTTPQISCSDSISF